MKWEFYDVKVKAKVEAEVTGKKIVGADGRARYAFKGETKDKHSLIAFVSKENFDKCKAKLVK